MTEQISYHSDEVRHIAAEVDAAIDAHASRAKALVMDAAQSQGERKWGHEALGAPAAFGEVYSHRLTLVERELVDLSQRVEEFSRRVQEAATRVDTTDDELAELLRIQERDLHQAPVPRAISHAQNGPGRGFVALG